jgi:hypothetical protein
MRACDPHSRSSSPHRGHATLDLNTGSPTASSTGRSVSLQAHYNSYKRLGSSNCSSPHTLTSPRRPRWDCSPRVLSSHTHNSNMSSPTNGVAMEQLQTPLQGRSCCILQTLVEAKPKWRVKRIWLQGVSACSQPGNAYEALFAASNTAVTPLPAFCECTPSITGSAYPVQLCHVAWALYADNTCMHAQCMAVPSVASTSH